MFLIIYLAIVCGSVGYDAKTIRNIRIPKAPDDIAKLLKTTTSYGELIHVILLRSFHNDEGLSQSDMTRYAQKEEDLPLTSQRIRDYVIKMEEAGLISSPHGRYEMEYHLTELGQWCREAVKQCFPRRLLLFYLRNGLGLKRLDDFPQRQVSHNVESVDREEQETGKE